MSLRLLLVLPQLAQDPATGAPRSMASIAEMLAASGFTVRGLTTTASEKTEKFEAAQHLRGLGLSPRFDKGPHGKLWFYSYRGVDYQALDVGKLSPILWERVQGRDFDALFDEALREFQPHFLLTFGGSPGDVRRRIRARLAGVKVVFGLRNDGYLAPGALAETDARLTPSQWLSDLYLAETGVDSTALPLPLEEEDIVAPERDPIFTLFVNPEIRKGLYFSVRLIEELAVRRPDIPVLVVESVGRAGQLAAAALDGGFDLRRHESVMVSPSVAYPRDLYGPARLLVAPSLREPAGRVAAEAMLNGVPPLVSDRGGLAEVCGTGGYVLPLPPDFTFETRQPVPPEAIAPWLSVIEHLYDNEPAYTAAAAKARSAAETFRWDHLRPRYAAFFQSLLP
jgi:glycosyltransferase involved in cell wall biosynthesis